jgi:chemotaxis protein methyltransferase CheR
VTPPAPLEHLRDAVADALGLWFDASRLDQLAEAAGRRTEALGLPSLEAYAARLAGDREEVRALAERLTVGETYFFRNSNDLRAFVSTVVPERVRARAQAGVRRLRFLSAGCSSGEEPYTLAMLLLDVPELAGWDVSVLGVDVNRAALARGARARYGAWSLRQTSDAQRARFFEPEGREHRVRDEVRAFVRLEQRNLVEEDEAFWAPGSFDAVFCRNVLMYFAPEVTRRVVSRITRAIAPDGYLFLGHAETLRGVSGDFHLRHTHDTFYYQRREAAASGEVLERAASQRVPAVELPPDDVDWIETIRRASERVARLAAPPAAGAGQVESVVAAAPTAAQRFAAALELHAQDRHAAALETLGEASPEEDTDALVLRAVLLASRSEPEQAERICTRILELDELNAEAHYVMALCREHAGDRAGAADHDHYALYLDPSFAMPRLHLGLLAKRGGDREGARRELGRARAALAAEDPSRLLLLGGGFGRDALVELCRAELRACGGNP